MKNRTIIKRFSLILVCMIFAGTMLAGCKDKTKNETGTSTETTVEDTVSVSEEAVEDTTSVSDEVDASVEESADTSVENTDIQEPIALGEGAMAFTFVVVDKDGNETTFAINTDAATVGEALVALELIEGDESDFGLYVKKVNGIVADYDVDQTYWAFYINGEYAMTGVDSTNVEDGATYMFKVE